jgi:predicted enzyme related to lactoylglutathione lyase
VERVCGIGGFFFRAQDPEALATWYDRHLGVRLTPKDYGSPSWAQEEGPTVFEPFPADTSHFRNPSKAWMLNFRVRNLEAMVAQLRSAGVAVEIDPQEYPNGRFARLADPEGNPVELWQPEGPAAPKAVGADAGSP